MSEAKKWEIHTPEFTAKVSGIEKSIHVDKVRETLQKSA